MDGLCQAVQAPPTGLRRRDPQTSLRTPEGSIVQHHSASSRIAGRVSAVPLPSPPIFGISHAFSLRVITCCPSPRCSPKLSGATTPQYVDGHAVFGQSPQWDGQPFCSRCDHFDWCRCAVCHFDHNSVSILLILLLFHQALTQHFRSVWLQT
jgi:hypothetical protein